MFNIFKQKEKDNTDVLAAIIKTDKNTLEAFENAYASHALNDDATKFDNFFDVNSRQAADKSEKLDDTAKNDVDYASLSARIIDELVSKTDVWSFDGENASVPSMKALPDNHTIVTANEIKALPVAQRPMLSGNLMSVDITEPSSITLLNYLNKYANAHDKNCYHRFRQGLDILDYDELMYAMIDTNPNSMSHWLPAIAENAVSHGFFKIPKTTIVHVPMTLLQLTRKDYDKITPATFDILDRYCMNVFGLDVNKEYFIKTGTYSSKFDFRNARVRGEKEVRELGEYLLFIHSQANQMAGPLSKPCIYGVSTTTEWVVREFIEDKENNPTIYKGMPLHTEYRVFVDFDSDDVIGIAPYWDPDTMKKRFAENRDIHDTHDGVIYKAHEDTLMARYEQNKDRVIAEIRRILPDTQLHGQWSIDVMQNGDDFYIIDMALAENSAFYDCVPLELRKPTAENWLPDENVIKTIMSTNQI